MPEGMSVPPGSSVILHDYVEQTDGGSRLCLTLGRAFGADFCCGFVRPGHPFFVEPYPGRVRTLMPALPVPLARQLALALAFERRAGFIREYDTAIFSGSYAPLAARHRAGQRNISYCHTPPRFLYDQHEFFRALAPRPLRPLFSAFCRWLRPRYEAALTHMSVVVANSEAVRERILRYLGVTARVVHPPCAVERYRFGPDQGYFLSLSRLDGLKRVAVAVEAFRRMPGQRLVVASDGPEAANLRRLAAGAPNIAFTGAVGEERLLDLLAHCRATLHLSRDEDFGMAAVESMAAGKPALVAGAGGYLETVVDGSTGVWLPADPEPEDVVRAVSALDANRAAGMAGACRERAGLYARERFLEGMEEACAARG
jgi:glycosyltransferase involved in cell wall biosynthesis